MVIPRFYMLSIQSAFLSYATIKVSQAGFMSIPINFT